jgi:hypothetical protein
LFDVFVSEYNEVSDIRVRNCMWGILYEYGETVIGFIAVELLQSSWVCTPGQFVVLWSKTRQFVVIPMTFALYCVGMSVLTLLKWCRASHWRLSRGQRSIPCKAAAVSLCDVGTKKSLWSCGATPPQATPSLPSQLAVRESYPGGTAMWKFHCPRLKCTHILTAAEFAGIFFFWTS